ncbi:MAG: ABC transporter permease subunit, partial [Anaerolineaceae bacterium]|nr:ABC transporter permease subunit [Anaerolineaceae bacterium]
MKKIPIFLKTILFIILAVAIIFVYALSIQVTKPDLEKLVTKMPNAKVILGQLFDPDLFEASTTELLKINLDLPVPCGSAADEAPLESGPRIIINPSCGNVGDMVVVEGFDLGKKSPISLRWILADGNTMGVKSFDADENGAFTIEIPIRPITVTADGKAPQIQAEVSMLSNKLVPSQALKDVVDAIMVTIFMALLATTIATIVAVPLSFLASANIVKKGCFGTSVYYFTRNLLSLIRSVDSLVLAIIFALIVGYGSPFGGVLALVIITTVSLGKMFSEAVESIDPGPIEALTATGANRLQVVWYAVVPQIIPDFLSYIIYHWDINVRISTIIGFVGGG